MGNCPIELSGSLLVIYSVGDRQKNELKTFMHVRIGWLVMEGERWKISRPSVRQACILSAFVSIADLEATHGLFISWIMILQFF